MLSDIQRGMQPIRIISDNVENRDNLAFGFDAYALAIAELIATKSNKTPFTLGISGKWGSGKTTLMKEIDRQLASIPVRSTDSTGNDDFRRIKCVWFEAWKYKDEDETLAALIDVIIQAIKEENGNFANAKNEKKEIVNEVADDLKTKVEKLSKSIKYRKIFSLLSKAAVNVDITEFFNDPDKENNLTYKDF
ncbi:hypothetical protein KAR48_09340 [bacterium]|nr:hypothetical protein [bacterium]